MTETSTQFRKILASDIVKVRDFAFDVYIKLSASKYIKIVTSDSDHFEEELSHYHKKASDYLYVDENAYFKISDILKNDVHQISSDEEMKIPPASKDNFGIASETYIITHKLLGKFGIKELELELIDNNFVSFFSNLRKQSELMKRLQRLLDQKDYIANHSLLTLYLTCLTMKKMGELNDSVQEKIIVASFFKDISLDNPPQAKIWRKSDPKLSSMSSTETAIILNHPTKSVEVAKKLKNFSPDIESMIRDHQELPDGTGFPRSQVAIPLSPIASVFNCSCHFAQEALLQGFNQPDAIQIFKKMDDLYSKGSLKTSYLTLKGLILNQDVTE